MNSPGLVKRGVETIDKRREQKRAEEKRLYCECQISFSTPGCVPDRLSTKKTDRSVNDFISSAFQPCPAKTR